MIAIALDCFYSRLIYKDAVKPIEFIVASRFIMAIINWLATKNSIKLLQPVYYGDYYIAHHMVSAAQGSVWWLLCWSRYVC